MRWVLRLLGPTLTLEKIDTFEQPIDLSNIQLSDLIVDHAVTDMDLIVLPMRGNLDSKYAKNIFGYTEKDGFTYSQLESDFDWVETYCKEVQEWAYTHNIKNSSKALWIPAHTYLLKCASSVLAKCIELKEYKQRYFEYNYVRQKENIDIDSMAKSSKLTSS